MSEHVNFLPSLAFLGVDGVVPSSCVRCSSDRWASSKELSSLGVEEGDTFSLEEEDEASKENNKV